MQRKTEKRGTDIQNDKFSFFQTPRSTTPQHELNWYVYRNHRIRGEMIRLWNGGKGIEGKVNLKWADTKDLNDAGASADQVKWHAINVLFRNMEMYGPYRNEFKNFKPDPKNDMLHCHISESKPSYVVMWEVDTDKKIINIVDMGPHENFDFKRQKSHKKKNAIAIAEAAREEDPNYIAHRDRQPGR